MFSAVDVEVVVVLVPATLAAPEPKANGLVWAVETGVALGLLPN